jgi:site-specific DNA-methyltransferase (adenine-specific)
MINVSYNPDVLSCLANLSNDEVFTPPGLANQILDLLPPELFKSKDTTFLDPVCKSGIFLREIAKRLMDGLEKEIPDKQERINHIFKNQVFGVAITELTSLLSRRSVYCSKTANGKYSICETFDDEQGNIILESTKHVWRNGKCEFCGASQEVYDRVDALETYAYQFIHTDKPEKIFNNMKFDVIIGNPPYQLSTGGSGVQATPLYNKFIQQAKKLNPRYLTMIVPSRWFSGGFGLDTFRDEMLHDDRIRAIHDYPEASDCFPGVQIKGGVCYFLWDRDNRGDCTVVTHRGNTIGKPETRPLLERNRSTFIRYNEAIYILHKIWKTPSVTMETLVSSQKPFGLPTNFKGNKLKKDDDVLVYGNKGLEYCSRNLITSNRELFNKHKVFIARAGSGSDSFPHQILGKPFIPKLNSVSTETYIYIGPFTSREQCENVMSYIATRFFRFLVMLMKPTQDALRKVYSLVPIQNFDESWTDEKLYKKYGITDEEIEFIESLIRPMELSNE